MGQLLELLGHWDNRAVSYFIRLKSIRVYGFFDSGRWDEDSSVRASVMIFSRQHKKSRNLYGIIGGDLDYVIG